MNFLGLSYRDGYFQMWALNSRLRRIPAVGPWVNSAVRWICGKLTGHHPSKTEWGYGGGDHADVWCRWCNQVGSMPLAQAIDRYENMRSTVWGLTSCDIRQGAWKPEVPNAASSTEGEKR